MEKVRPAERAQYRRDLRIGIPTNSPFEDIEGDTNRNKHERFLREELILDSIFPTFDSIPQMDREFPSDVENQTQALIEKMRDQIDAAITLNPYTIRHVEQIVPLFRNKHKKRMEFYIQSGHSKLEAALETMSKDILGKTLDGGVKDMRAIIHTLVHKVDSQNPNISGKELAKILRENVSLAYWFASLHGVNDAYVKRFLGRNVPLNPDEESPNDNMSYDPNKFIIFGDPPKIKPSAEVDEFIIKELPKLLDKDGIKIITDTVKCAALSTHVIKGIWLRLVEIYEKSGALSTVWE